MMVSATCQGERCWCGLPAVKKVGEEIPFDDALPARHNLTAYICAEHYAQLMGPLGAEQVGIEALGSTQPDGELVERVARAIAPRIFFEFDADTMDRAAQWEVHSDKDQTTIRLIAQDAIAAGVGSTLMREAPELALDCLLVGDPMQESPRAQEAIRKARAALSAMGRSHPSRGSVKEEDGDGFWSREPALIACATEPVSRLGPTGFDQG